MASLPNDDFLSSTHNQQTSSPDQNEDGEEERKEN